MPRHDRRHRQAGRRHWLLRRRRLLAERLEQRTMLDASGLLDWGDAPDDSLSAAYQYPTQLADDGARHAINSLRLGQSIDEEADGQPTLAANGDGGDDDGVVLQGVFTEGFATPISLTASGPGLLYAWIDFNRDGQWSGPEEKVFDGITVAEGANALSITTPAGASLGETFARFRLSSDTSASQPTGLANDGEVEDYLVEIISNSPPVVANPIADVLRPEDASELLLDVSGVFDDPDLHNGNGDVLTLEVSTNSNPTLVSAIITGTTLRLEFLPDQFGQASISVTATDHAGRTISDSFDVSVTEVNDAPLLQNDQATVLEDTALIVDVTTLLSNDQPGPANEAGQTLSITAVTPSSVQGGSVTLLGDGTICYVPPSNYFGPDVFAYSVIDDGTTASSPDPKAATALVSILVGEVNDAPQAADDTATTAEGTLLTLSDLLVNDVPGPPSESNQTLTITSVSSQSQAGGAVLVAADGSVTYQPPVDFFGIDSFTYTLHDNGTTSGVADPLSATATVTITVTEVNDAPLAGEDQVTTDEDTALSFPAAALLANDAPGPDNEASQQLSVLNVAQTSAQGGQVSLSDDGTITYTPPADFFGEDQFVYAIGDNGTTAGVSDPQAAVGVVRVTVRPINDAPVAAEDQTTTPEDIPLSLLPALLLDNDTAGPPNENSQQRSIIAVSAASAQGGLVVLQPDGSITYTPAENFHGQDSFTYTIQDDGTTAGAADPLTAVGTVTVEVTSVNDAPVVADIQMQVSEDGPAQSQAFAGQDVDEGDPPLTLTYTILSQPAAGELRIAANGFFAFEPASAFEDLAVGQTRQVSFTYKATDPQGTDSEPATVSIVVEGQNDAPVANDTEIQVDEGQQLVGQLAADDADSDDDSSTLGYSILQPPSAGTVTLQDEGGFQFDPGEDFDDLPEGISREVSFVFQVTDAHGGTSQPATVTLTIIGKNNPPTAFDVTAGASEDGPPVTAAFVGDDADDDEDGSTLAYVIVSQPSEGTVINNQDGTFTFDPGDGFQDLPAQGVREVVFTYQARDAQNALSNVAPVRVAVQGQNDAPTVSDDEYLIEVGQTLEVSGSGVLSNDLDIDGDTLQVEVVSGPANGTVDLRSDGSFTYTPDPGFSGSDSFTYEAKDASAASVASVLIMINLPPVAMDDHAETVREAPVTIGVAFNDFDNDGTIDPGSVAIVDEPQHGTATINGDGTVTYTPATGFSGSDSFTYTVDDNLGATSNEATVSIDVLPIFSACPWQNPQNALDVNADGSVTPMDALLIINELNRAGSHPLPNPPIPPQAPPPFYDVNCDNSVTPADALAVINFLNSRPAFGAEGGGNAGEGEPGVDPSVTRHFVASAGQALPHAVRYHSGVIQPTQASAVGQLSSEVRDDHSLARYSVPSADEALPHAARDHTAEAALQQCLEELELLGSPELEELLADIANDVDQAA